VLNLKSRHIFLSLEIIFQAIKGLSFGPCHNFISQRAKAQRTEHSDCLLDYLLGIYESTNNRPIYFGQTFICGHEGCDRDDSERE